MHMCPCTSASQRLVNSQAGRVQSQMSKIYRDGIYFLSNSQVLMTVYSHKHLSCVLSLPARVQCQKARMFALWWGSMSLPAFCIKQDSSEPEHLTGISQLGRAILCSIRGLARPAEAGWRGVRVPCKDGHQQLFLSLQVPSPTRRQSLLKMGGLCERVD